MIVFKYDIHVNKLNDVYFHSLSVERVSEEESRSAEGWEEINQRVLVCRGETGRTVERMRCGWKPSVCVCVL